MPKNHVTAFFRVSPGVPGIDIKRGILLGVKLMEVGKLAVFEGPDGNPREAMITPEHVSSLLKFAGNDPRPIHWTHGWHKYENTPEADAKELEARCGAWKDFRKDDDGNAIADAYLEDGLQRGKILFAAEHTPKSLMASAVFNYDPNDPKSIPLNFRCADFVPIGAGTTAMFSATDTQTQKTPMDIQELLTALDDPAVKAAVKAILKSHTGPGEDDPADSAPAAEMEKDAGVTDADKKPEDDKKPAMLRAAVRVSRAIVRQTAALKTERTAILAEAKIQAGAEATALLGKGAFHSNAGGEGGNGKDEYKEAVTAALSAGAKSRGEAIMFVQRNKPKIYEAHMRAIGG